MCVSLLATQEASSGRQLFLWIANINPEVTEEVLKRTNSSCDVEMASCISMHIALLIKLHQRKRSDLFQGSS